MNKISKQEAKRKSEEILNDILDTETFSLRPVEVGSSNHTFIADQSFVIKIEKKKGWRENIVKESSLLEILGDEKELKTPKLIDSGFIDGLNYRIIEFIEGETIDQYSSGRNFYKLSEEEKKVKSKMIGETLAKVHLSKSFRKSGKIKTRGTRGIYPDSEAWSKGILELQKWWNKRLREDGYGYYAGKSEEILESYSKRLDLFDNPKLLHMEFDLRNLIFQEDEVIVLDWETASAGDPMLDLVMTEKRLVWRQEEDFEIRDAFRKGYRSFKDISIDSDLEKIYEVFQLTRFLLIHQDDKSMKRRIELELELLFSDLKK